MYDILDKNFCSKLKFPVDHIFKDDLDKYFPKESI